MGGSTKAWLQDMLPNNAGEGGFLPRFLIVEEDSKFQRIANPTAALGVKNLTKLLSFRVEVFQEFVGLVRYAQGKFDFLDPEAEDEYSFWYNTYMPDSGALAPFAARAGSHVLRLALLSAVSCGRGSISSEDIKAGIGLYSYTESKLKNVVIPMSPQGKLLSKLLDTLGNESMSDTHIRRAMRNYCGARDTDNMLEDLLKSKEVARDGCDYRRVRI